ncbi:MAG: hypothetical protein FD153_941 [Rhodospirillaceae bacterium]|nr:MAG: hypothetical protein FD153_941 [Rhodospirillaceae bacterium]
MSIAESAVENIRFFGYPSDKKNLDVDSGTVHDIPAVTTSKPVEIAILKASHF